MASLTDSQLKRAEARGRQTLETEPCAVKAQYDAIAGRIVVDLVDGCAYAFPTEWVQELSGASGDDLADVEIDGAEFNLLWPKLDVDLYVPALASGIFGSRDWITGELARIAGKSKSPTKAAARINGAKGGWPRTGGPD